MEPADTVSPEVLYDRRWAYMWIDRTLERLRTRFRESEREATFDGLKVWKLVVLLNHPLKNPEFLMPGIKSPLALN